MNEIVENNKEKKIRKIEDIIDIQKAKGSFGGKQVAFSIPSAEASSASVGFARSLESGLPRAEGLEGPTFKKHKRHRAKRHKSPDLSWPSGSDVTVLRLKVNLENDLKETIASATPGDGLHLPDSSSMVNLATLLQAPSSKHSVNIEEYLLPLSSWEHGQELCKEQSIEESGAYPIGSKPLSEIHNYGGSSRLDEVNELGRNMDETEDRTNMTKAAKFMTYFCFCCSRPLNQDKIHETPYTNSSNVESCDR